MPQKRNNDDFPSSLSFYCQQMVAPTAQPFIRDYLRELRTDAQRRRGARLP